MIECTACGQTFQRRSGLAGHMQFKHPKAPGAPAPADPEEEIAMADTPCSTCADTKTNARIDLQEKDREIRELREGLEAAKQRDGAQDHPSVDTFLAHCRAGSADCQHGAQWKAFELDFTRQVLDKVSDEFVMAAAVRRGLVPERIRVLVP